MSAPLVDRLRALALHQDLAECTEAADRIEALEAQVSRLVAEVRSRMGRAQ